VIAVTGAADGVLYQCLIRDPQVAIPLPFGFPGAAERSSRMTSSGTMATTYDEGFCSSAYCSVLFGNGFARTRTRRLTTKGLRTCDPAVETGPHAAAASSPSTVGFTGVTRGAAGIGGPPLLRGATNRARRRSWALGKVGAVRRRCRLASVLVPDIQRGEVQGDAGQQPGQHDDQRRDQRKGGTSRGSATYATAPSHGAAQR
jgi:hypothetical protein